MSRDSDILGALRFEPMTAAEIGRGFAPDHIKDRAAWGRKWVVKHLDWLTDPHGDGVLRPMAWVFDEGGPAHAKASEPTYTGPDFTRVPLAPGFFNVATELLHSWLANTMGLLDPHRYRAPHAPRGTPPRPRTPRGYFPKALKGHI